MGPALVAATSLVAVLAAPLLVLWVYGWFRGFGHREPVHLVLPRPTVEVVSLEPPRRKGRQWTRARLVVRCRGAESVTLRMLVDGEPYDDRGLRPQAVAEDDEVTWRWRVLRRVPAGTWPLVVTAEGERGRTQHVIAFELDWAPTGAPTSRPDAHDEAAATQIEHRLLGAVAPSIWGRRAQKLDPSGSRAQKGDTQRKRR